LITRKNYITSYLFLLILIFFTFILFVNYFTSDAQGAFVILLILAFFSIISFFKFEVSLLLFIFFIPLYHVVGRFFGVSRFFTIVSMFIGCLFGGILYLAKQKKLLIDLNQKISTPIIIFTIFITISVFILFSVTGSKSSSKLFKVKIEAAENRIIIIKKETAEIIRIFLLLTLFIFFLL